MDGKRQKGWIAFFLLLIFGTTAVQAQPTAKVAEAQQLLFQTAPLQTRGTLQQQVRQGLKSFKAPLVHLRVFVVGTENAARARQFMLAALRERRAPMPALSVIAVGGLSQPGAWVLLEAVLQSSKRVNPRGIAFISGQPASTEQPSSQVMPLIEKSLADLSKAQMALALMAPHVLRATCFVSALGDAAAVEARLRRDFPQAAHSVVQLQRSAPRGLVECELVARLAQAVSEPLQFLNPPGLNASPNYAHVALIGARRVVFSGQHLGISLQEADARNAFVQLRQTLENSGASIQQVAMSSLFPISPAASDLLRKTRFDFYDKTRPPASTLLLFEGLPQNAAFAVDVVAVIQE